MISNRQRLLLAEAKELEKRRVEITSQALEQKIADLLPETWAQMIETDGENEHVEVAFTTGLTERDGELLTARDCRGFVAFVGMLADQKRLQLQVESDEHS